MRPYRLAEYRGRRLPEPLKRINLQYHKALNTFGRLYRLTSFGESHGPAIGGVIDGLPAGSVVSLAGVQAMLDRRRPGQSTLTTARHEADRVRFLSGLMAYDTESKELAPLTPDTDRAVALGTPIGFMVKNADHRSSDYDRLKNVYRPSHADYSWEQRYGLRDWRGGGRASGRETISRVVAGALAMQMLELSGVTISSRIAALGDLTVPTKEQIEQAVAGAKADADSLGGIVECTISGMAAGVGEPVFGKLQQTLASAMLSIGAVKGFDYGMGFRGVCARGSSVTDEFIPGSEGKIATATNYSGGIQGGISNGMDINFRVAVKPTPTIARPLHTVDSDGKPTVIETHGRHDPCILMRVPVVIEAMAAITVYDAILQRSVGAEIL